MRIGPDSGSAGEVTPPARSRAAPSPPHSVLPGERDPEVTHPRRQRLEVSLYRLIYRCISIAGVFPAPPVGAGAGGAELHTVAHTSTGPRLGHPKTNIPLNSLKTGDAHATNTASFIKKVTNLVSL